MRILASLFLCFSLSAFADNHGEKGKEHHGKGHMKEHMNEHGKGKKVGHSLFHRLGGKKAITSVVDQFVANCGADTRINKYFAHLVADAAKMKNFKNHLVDQVCEATGGPCKYKGRDMKTAHANYSITEEDWNALVEGLVKSLDSHKVPTTEKGELIGKLATMKSDIVRGTPAATTTN